MEADRAETPRGSKWGCQNGLGVTLAKEPGPWGQLATPCPTHKGLEMILIVIIIW